MDELHVARLAVMHAGYRLGADAARRLLHDVKHGAVFDRVSLAARDARKIGLVAVTRFEDGRLAIRDGLHRATAIMHMRSSGSLWPEEYAIEDMTYEMFLQPNLAAGFYTPFDPRSEVRIADWSELRREIRRRIAANIDPLNFIESQRKTYTQPRQPFHNSLDEFFRHCASQESDVWQCT